MKNMKKVFLITMIITTVFAGCREEFDDIGEPFDRSAGLGGDWQLSKVTQNDEDAIRKGFPSFVQSSNITDLFPFNEFRLVLNVDEEGKPSDFTVDAGNAPDFIGLSAGSWTVDNVELPSQIFFGGQTSLDITTYNGLSEGIMRLKLTRFETKSDGSLQAFLSYDFEFVKL